MRSLAESENARRILERLRSLQPGDVARWGRMNVHQMLCHLTDSMRIPLGEFKVSDAESPQLQRVVLKWAALYIPLQWRRNFPTRPEIDQCRLNLALGDFAQDQETTIALAKRLSEADLAGKRHPYFGPMTRTEWLRWGWLHADHHLRQFGR